MLAAGKGAQRSAAGGGFARGGKAPPLFSGAISEPEAAEKQLLFIVSVQKRETPGALSPFSVSGDV